MAGIRVLVVDDSVVICKGLCEAVASDQAIDVAGSAADGSIALAKIPQLNPDLITLDVEMPVMSGLETLAEIGKTYPRLPVIMFSTLTERGDSITLDALALGASDYVTKPSNTGSLEQTRPRSPFPAPPSSKKSGVCIPTRSPTSSTFTSIICAASLISGSDRPLIRTVRGVGYQIGGNHVPR